jgi:hypothetical protein
MHELVTKHEGNPLWCFQPAGKKRWTMTDDAVRADIGKIDLSPLPPPAKGSAPTATKRFWGGRWTPGSGGRIVLQQDIPTANAPLLPTQEFLREKISAGRRIHRLLNSPVFSVLSPAVIVWARELAASAFHANRPSYVFTKAGTPAN